MAISFLLSYRGYLVGVPLIPEPPTDISS